MARIKTMLVIFVFTGVSVCPGQPAKGQQELRAKAMENLFPLRKAPIGRADPIWAERVALGRLLFFEPRVSLDGTVSCSRCHLPQLHATDALPLSVGTMGRPNPRNAPTVLNAALHISQHWRGDRTSLEDQATRALLGPSSYGNPTFQLPMDRLKAIEGYAQLFKRAFPADPDPVTPENWGVAIGAYERTLLTPSRLDAWLEGNDGSLTPNERKGLERFLDLGCADCHRGVGLGGSMYEKFGIHQDYWEATGSKHIDKGRADVTGDPRDLYVFKVPSLRNVAMTAPYFHDGSVADLREAVQIMSRTQLGQELGVPELEKLLSFLRALTGDVPKELAHVPALPEGAFR
ncbi:MAG: cytochrome-c peroxidase [Thermodesulfobacteriota bacterium]